MLGYLLDENDFEVTPAISRGIQFFELTEKVSEAPYQINKVEETGIIEINLTFYPSINNSIIPIEFNCEFTEIITQNIDDYEILLDDVLQTIPFTSFIGQDLKINILKSVPTSSATITLKGTFS